MSTHLDLSDAGHLNLHANPPEVNSERTRRIYDAVAPLYTLSSRMFHSRAHRAALAAARIQNGARVLEVAIGSGEMLSKLAEVNPDGQTLGVDFSPNMAAHSQSHVRARFPKTHVYCQAADGRSLPFANGSFDAVICCFFFELLAEEDVAISVAELSRVLRPGGRLVTTLVGQNKSSFNALYKLCTQFAPAFWGRQRSQQVVELLHNQGYRLETDMHVRQLYYSSRIVAATQATAAAACAR